jgi:hypothetical protein
LIPCGFAFSSENASDQRMMVVQPGSATVPAGGEITLTAFVTRVDRNNSAPSSGAGYSLGSMGSGDVVRLAPWACQRDLGGGEDPLAGAGLMLAGWSIRNGRAFANLLDEEAVGAMRQVLGRDTGQDLSARLESFAGPAQEWFDRCGIESP